MVADADASHGFAVLHQIKFVGLQRAALTGNCARRTDDDGAGAVEVMTRCDEGARADLEQAVFGGVFAVQRMRAEPIPRADLHTRSKFHLSQRPKRVERGYDRMGPDDEPITSDNQVDADPAVPIDGVAESP